MINGISNAGAAYSPDWSIVSGARENARSNANADLNVNTTPTVIPAAQPETPVQPVTPVPQAPQIALDKTALLRLFDTDPAAMLVRGRIQYEGNPEAVEGGENVRKNQGASESKNAREVLEDTECETCKKRKYQDGSDDPGVSFKTPSHISPDQALSAVRGHENEHVTREQAKAEREGRKVVAQNVTYYNAICPECGRIYVSGGTTRTVTAGENEPQQDSEAQMLYPLGLGKTA